MNFKIFYADYAEDQHISSDEAQSASLVDIVECMHNLLAEPDNFIGLIDSNDVMLQFMVEEDGAILIDAPVNDRNGSFMKSAKLSECIEVVRGLRATIEIEKIPGLEFKPW